LGKSLFLKTALLSRIAPSLLPKVLSNGLNPDYHIVIGKAFIDHLKFNRQRWLVDVTRVERGVTPQSPNNRIEFQGIDLGSNIPARGESVRFVVGRPEFDSLVESDQMN